MPDADEIREQQRRTWDEFSGGWAKWDGLVGSMLEPVKDEMVRSLALEDDGEHLEVATGTGEPGLSIAAMLPRGRVVLTDLSAGMLAAARANAAERGLTNVELRECGVDALPFDDSSFDTVGCRFGLMFFPDIPRAVAELVRVLRPGGRIAVAVWAEPAGNPWATIPIAAIGTEVDLPAPRPDAPGLFRCAAPDTIGAVFREAGLEDVVESEVVSSLDTASADEYWSFTSEVAAPVVAGLAQVGEGEARARIQAAIFERLRPYERDGRLSVPTHARCIAGRKPLG